MVIVEIVCTKCYQEKKEVYSEVLGEKNTKIYAKKSKEFRKDHIHHGTVYIKAVK